MGEVGEVSGERRQGEACEDRAGEWFMRGREKGQGGVVSTVLYEMKPEQ